MGWSSPEDGFVVRDINSDGLINDGSEMFGEATLLGNGQRAKDGFEALADLDSNQDGVIDNQDTLFNDLLIWKDSNSNGVTDEGELLSLANQNITSLDLHSLSSDRTENGNQLKLISTYTTNDGLNHEMADVWLSTLFDSGVVSQANAKTPSLSEQDWMGLSGIASLYGATQQQSSVTLHTDANQGLVNIDLALVNELTLLAEMPQFSGAMHDAALKSIDVLSHFTSPDLMGDLINTLSNFGVANFVADASLMQISDNLLKTLVDAGMLEALPTSNLSIDVNHSFLGQNSYLFTSLKTMADLGVDKVHVNDGISQIYIDLGLPTDDPNAINDIRALLEMLDLGGGSKLVQGDLNSQDFTLVISSELANSIKNANAEGNGFTQADLDAMSKLGIHSIAILDPNNSNSATQNDIFGDQLVAQTPLDKLPDVQIIGSQDPMHDHLMHDIKPV